MAAREVRRECVRPIRTRSFTSCPPSETATAGPQAFNDEMRFGGETGESDILDTGREKFSTARGEGALPALIDLGDEG
jgi:hypothetical protein